ncbi:MAG: hypothetical protein WD872_05260 [Pirellulaceae bacterium]
MPAIAFDRDEMAGWYARQHLQTDPGVSEIYYLPSDSPEREIRFVEVNELIADRLDSALEPVDFGVDRDTQTEHTLLVLDVTPDQWDRIHKRELALPRGWSLSGAVEYVKN